MPRRKLGMILNGIGLVIPFTFFVVGCVDLEYLGPSFLIIGIFGLILGCINFYIIAKVNKKPAFVAMAVISFLFVNIVSFVALLMSMSEELYTEYKPAETKSDTSKSDDTKLDGYDL